MLLLLICCINCGAVVDIVGSAVVVGAGVIYRVVAVCIGCCAVAVGVGYVGDDAGVGVRGGVDVGGVVSIGCVHICDVAYTGVVVVTVVVCVIAFVVTV